MANKKRVVIQSWNEADRGRFEGSAYRVLVTVLVILVNADAEYRDLEFVYNTDGEYTLTGVRR